MNARRRVLRTGVTVAVTVFAATAVVALATDNLHPSPKSPAALSTGDSLTPAVSAPAAAPAAAPAPASGGIGSVPSGAPDVTTPGAGPSAPSATGGTSAPPGSRPSPTTPGTKSVAIATGLLKITAFGSHTGLPLLCGVVLGGLGPVLTNPVVSKLAATVGSSCVTFGTSGSAALLGLNDQLLALRAANPALDPAITAFANFFNTVGSQPGVPFGSSVVALGYLVLFFTG